MSYIASNFSTNNNSTFHNDKGCHANAEHPLPHYSITAADKSILSETLELENHFFLCLIAKYLIAVSASSYDYHSNQLVLVLFSVFWLMASFDCENCSQIRITTTLSGRQSRRVTLT